MKLTPFVIRIIVIIFFGLISYGLTASIAVRSTMGIILAVVSLSAAIMFLYLLPKLYQQESDEQTTES